MTSSDFNELFRKAYHGNVTVQDGDELKYIYDLMHGCKSYLEVGTAEGGSLSVLVHALENDANIVCIDRDSGTVGKERNRRIKRLNDEGYTIKEIIGNSHTLNTINSAKGEYDCVLIDAGHKLYNVVADAVTYGYMAKKYIFFHDIMLEDVRAAFDWFVKQNNFKKTYTYVKSEKFGYGVIEV